MKTYILASKNKHKAEEIKQILGEDYEIKTMSEVGLENFEIKEDGKTFEENAAKKAIQVYNLIKMPTIADDSGLCVDYLDGAPGIYTARFAGKNASDNDNINKLLKELDGVSFEKRKAKFVCVIAFIESNEKPKFFRGECSGFITDKRFGKSGFGYDPIFYYPEFNCTLAGLEIEEKNKISHRYKALKKFSDSINKKI